MSTSPGPRIGPPSKPDRRRRRRPGVKILAGRAGLAFAAVIGAMVFLAATRGGTVTRQAPSFASTAERIAVFAGFGIDQVEIVGHRQTPEAQIFDTLDLGNVRSLGRFDSRAVRARIERLPWIANAEVSRVYPGRVRIAVTERQPFAVWLRGRAAFLIDRRGRSLTAIAAGTLGDLPRISGEGAEAGAAALYDMLAGYPVIAARLAMAERVGERRWRLHLRDRSVVDLPAESPEAAIARIAGSGVLDRLLSGGAKVVDLRSLDRIATRPAPPASSALPAAY